MDAIDKLLNELKAEYSNSAQPQKQPQPIVEEFTAVNIATKSSLVDNLLAAVKSDFDELDKTEELRKKQELEQLKLQKLEALKQQAEEWLEELDPFSPEGLWFERFAEKYSDKLTAALEYLENN